MVSMNDGNVILMGEDMVKSGWSINRVLVMKVSYLLMMLSSGYNLLFVHLK